MVWFGCKLGKEWRSKTWLTQKNWNFGPERQERHMDCSFQHSLVQGLANHVLRWSHKLGCENQGNGYNWKSGRAHSVTKVFHWGIPCWFSYWPCMLLGALEEKGLPLPQLCLLLRSGLSWTRVEDISPILTPVSAREMGAGVRKKPSLSTFSLPLVHTDAHTHTRV